MCGCKDHPHKLARRPALIYSWPNGMRAKITQYQFGRYSVVGLITALLYLLLNFAFLNLAGLNLTASSLFSHLIVAFVAFYVNHAWTFMAQGKRREYIFKYFTVVGISLCINAAIVMAAQSLSSTYSGIAIFVVFLMIPLINFFCHKYWTFFNV